VLAGQGGSLVLAGPCGVVAQVLSLTGVSRVIPVAGTVADAVASLSGQRRSVAGAQREHP
jgi:hypothetical protein